MSFKQTLKYLGFSENTVEWSQSTLPYKNSIQEVASLPFQTAEIRHMVKELSTKEKSHLASLLQFFPGSRGKKSFPEILFHKELNQYMQDCKRDNENAKLRLFIALREVLSPLLEAEDDYSLNQFLAKQRTLIKTFGPWHYYWALYFHPGKTKNSAQWEQTIQELPSRFRSWGMSEDEYESSHGKEHDPLPSEEEEKLKNKLHKLEKKIKKEVQLRQEVEEMLAKEKSESGKMSIKLEQATSKINRLEASVNSEQEKVEDVTSKYEQQKEKMREEQSAWSAEKTALQKQLYALKAEVEDKEEAVKRKDKETQSLLKEIEKIKGELQQKPQSKDLVKSLVPLLYDEVVEITNQLRGTPLSSDSSSEMLRQQVKEMLTLVDHLEKHVRTEEHLADTKLEDARTDINVADVVETKEVIQKEEAPTEEQDRKDETDDRTEEDDWYTGTFYRLDHGGYITLEQDVDSFRITESMVLEHNLQHEAEVRCRPIKSEKETTYYEIELLFQGDDNYSDINQYDGYVELGDHHIFYCVEMNEPGTKYKIHGKDAMIHQLHDGLPCTFNVADGNHIARISKIHRMYEPNQQKNDVPHGETILRSKSQKKKTKSKPSQYLKGARIVVVGGQKKWFESVVLETGAEFLHNDGYAPERIHADLKRSDALFLCLQANSHRATWGCMDVAKEYNVPHFIIEGSKSNLRQLIWENRELIR